ncbi:hypothetical protein GCM10011519_02170 [Marmoricola endophyticus]|uniref:DUF1097 domain-containing protein n=1 Tax=Marmoricola endophyticus TaxID=2040280 RepID=A0A917EZ12_9ACTN|nr:hypothetical protein [Marmoricola endophyticus]GGF32337.1 hypothetical protein GCM10011519_02170 [Marmoricola endophyticus]
MRTHILAGVVLALAAGLIVVLSRALGLDLDSVALLGGAVGAVVALVPDRSAGARLVGFAAGFLAAWVGYILRAAVLPDSDGGRSVAAMLTVLICVGVVVLTRDRLPLWSLLLGAGTFAGAYELTFAAAPPEVVTTSLSTATTLVLTVAVGFFAAAVVGAHEAVATPHTHRAGHGDAPADEPSRTDLMGAEQ